MKMITLFLLLISSLAYATDQTELSKSISESIQKELVEAPAGKYQISLMGLYHFPVGPNGPQTSRPVFLSALETYELPQDLLSCAENPKSLVCAAAGEFINWHRNTRPANQGILKIKFIMFQHCDGYFCPFYKEAQISVKINL